MSHHKGSVTHKRWQLEIPPQVPPSLATPLIPRAFFNHIRCSCLRNWALQWNINLSKTTLGETKVNLHSIRFSYVFVRFFAFLLLLDKVCAFSSAFLCVHIRTNQTVTYGKKVFRKKIFCKGVQLYFEISLLSFIHKIFEQNFYLYIL